MGSPVKCSRRRYLSPYSAPRTPHLRRGDSSPKALPDWISSHVRAFLLGGVAQQTVSDNLKAGITGRASA